MSMRVMMNMKLLRRWFGAVLLSLGLLQVSLVHAELAPDQMIQGVTDRVLQRLKAEKTELDAHPERVYAFANELADEFILPHYDFEGMSRWILGRNWRSANEDQRVRFQDEFRHMLINTYATALLSYSDQEIVFLPYRADPNDDQRAQVRAEFRPSGSPAIPIIYSLHRAGDGWKVYDVAIDGISLVTTYRSGYATEIRNHGIDGLLQKMADKNRTQAQAVVSNP
ncbi:MAG: MlaC/ttg2D family ABC transporter substrate-binding protein [Gammaproteobacteria bacterium]